MVLNEEQLVTTQFGVVLLLAVISFQAADGDKLRAFRFLAMGWMANFLYLCASVGGRPVAAAFHLYQTHLRFPAVFFNFLASTFFWFAAHKGGVGKRLIFLKGLNSWYFFIVPSVFLMISVVLSELLPQGAYLGFFFSNVSLILLDFFSLLALNCYLGERTDELDASLSSPGNAPLLFGTVCYAFIQLLQLISFGKYRGTIQSFGFFLGLGAKILILLGIIQLLAATSNAMTRLNAERQAEQERSREFGRIVDVLAHELSTPISEILNRIEDLYKPSKLTETINRIESAASRADALLIASKLRPQESRGSSTQEIKTANYDDSENRSAVESANVNALIEIAQSSVKAVRQEHVSFRHHYSANCCISCVPNEIIQVLVNLFRNSYDALSDNQGVIDVRTVNHRFELEDSQEQKAVERVVQITIRDDGEGISDGDKHLLFSPGFTTRVGNGRGNGLTVVKTIVQKYAGSIEVNSPPLRHNSARGTEVILTFPRVRCGSNS